MLFANKLMNVFFVLIIFILSFKFLFVLKLIIHHNAYQIEPTISGFFGLCPIHYTSSFCLFVDRYQGDLILLLNVFLVFFIFIAIYKLHQRTNANAYFLAAFYLFIGIWPLNIGVLQGSVISIGLIMLFFVVGCAIMHLLVTTFSLLQRQRKQKLTWNGLGIALLILLVVAWLAL